MKIFSYFFLTLTFVAGIHSYVLAAEGSAGKNEAGLPQFDPTWFASQIFWLVVFFTVLYLFFAKHVLPSLSSSIENRRSHIQSDLEAAENLSRESEDVKKAYETDFQKAQENAIHKIRKIEEELKQEFTEQEEKLQAQYAQEIAKLEKDIQSTEQKLKEDLKTLVADLSHQASQKITGMKADQSNVKDIVDGIYKAQDNKAGSKAKAA